MLAVQVQALVALLPQHEGKRALDVRDSIQLTPEVVGCRLKFVELDGGLGRRRAGSTFEAAGLGGYEELADHATIVPVAGTTVAVASLDDVIRSKETADRPKDRATLPVLYGLRDEIAESNQRRRSGTRDSVR